MTNYKMIIVEAEFQKGTYWLIKKYKDVHYYYNILQGFDMAFPSFRKTSKSYLFRMHALSKSKEFKEFVDMKF